MRRLATTMPALVLLGAGPALALDRFVATTGVDAGDCTQPAAPCLTVQYAIGQASVADAVRLAPGTYATDLVAIEKPLTLAGAQFGIDARTRAGPESILSASQGVSVAASNVVIDGLTIRDSSAAFTGYGVWLTPGVSGSRVTNNIFEDNTAGLGLANAGAESAVVQFNLFRGNNRPGAHSGTAIHSDEFASGAVADVVISDNLFVDNANAAIAFSSTDPAQPASAITIAHNVVDGGGRGAYFFQVQSTAMTDNTIVNLGAPADGGSSAAIAVFGPTTGLSILRNALQSGPAHGIRIAAGNAGLAIHRNRIEAFALAAMRVDGAPAGTSSYASCNWWGSGSGPAHPVLNPGGNGGSVVGDLRAANFTPWLQDPAAETPCVDPSLFANGFEQPAG